jgi:hypothetical protein
MLWGEGTDNGFLGVFSESKLIHARNVRQGGGLLCACAEIKTLAAEMRAFLSPGGVRG